MVRPVIANQKRKKIARRPVTDQVTEKLLQYIRDSKTAGEKLPSERRLMETFSVGRSSLREALRSLEATGIIVTRTGEGTFVTNDGSAVFRRPIEWRLFQEGAGRRQMLEARSIFEAGIAELAASRATEAELAELATIVAQLESTGPPAIDQFLSLDYRFHDLMAAASRNDVLRDTLMLTHRVLIEERENLLSSVDDYRRSAAIHRDIYEALAARDPARSRAAMLDHMKWTERLFERE